MVNLNNRKQIIAWLNRIHKTTFLFQVRIIAKLFFFIFPKWRIKQQQQQQNENKK